MSSGNRNHKSELDLALSQAVFRLSAEETPTQKMAVEGFVLDQWLAELKVETAPAREALLFDLEYDEKNIRAGCTNDTDQN